MTNRAAQARLADGDSLEYVNGKAVLTLHLTGEAACWFANHLPAKDGMTETFRVIAERLGHDVC